MFIKISGEDSRLGIAEKVFNWKKATYKDVARELQTTEEELNELKDEEFLDLLFCYVHNRDVSNYVS